MTDPLIAIIKGYESFGGGVIGGKSYPYHGAADAPGVLTVGFGHVLSRDEVRTGRFKDGLTVEEAEQLLLEDLKPRIRLAQTLIRKADRHELGAFVDLLYNCGTAPLVGSPGIQHNKGNKRSAAMAMPLYDCGCRHRHLLGLWRRRLTDVLYYLTGELIVARDSASEDRLTKRLASMGYSWVKPVDMH